MQELTTDLWSMLLPEEWFAEQDNETIMVIDEDEVSIIEITPFVPEKGQSVNTFLQEIVDKDAQKTTLAGLPAWYREVEEDEMFWREWYCDADKFVLLVSHGTDVSNKNMDDGSVDDILSTLLVVEE